eukprot:TRINITY_DN7042_c0_g1_i1.p1 TRINITY_DN7042_c0_g1~~TRINITY_DN7042_c0_g1_i1.p1  ORF type:complete len:284 (-),score=79.10 TRINITY_DN7042_c0_g1_i1:48-899(-)
MRLTCTSGSHEDQGYRPTMEDALIFFDDLRTSELPLDGFMEGENPLSFYAVYDGHGGKRAAKLAKELLHVNLFKNEKFLSGDHEAGITESFLETDKGIMEVAVKEDDWGDGSTGVVSVLLGDKLITANIGDSEAILISEVDGELKTDCLVTLHKANDADEKQRITDLGGLVFFGRVFGSLAVSRSFGDSKYKEPKTSANFVSAEPAINVSTINPSHKALVLACDGLWDVCEHSEVAFYVQQRLELGESPQEIAESLVRMAIQEYRTEDNVSVIVVVFNWEEEQ